MKQHTVLSGNPIFHSITDIKCIRGSIIAEVSEENYKENLKHLLIYLLIHDINTDRFHNELCTEKVHIK